MPVKLGKKGDYQTVNPTAEWQSIQFKKLSEQDFRIADELFLIETARVK